MMYSVTSAAQLACCAQAASATEQASPQTSDEMEIAEGVFEGPMGRWVIVPLKVMSTATLMSNAPPVSPFRFLDLARVSHSVPAQRRVRSPSADGARLWRQLVSL